MDTSTFRAIRFETLAGDVLNVTIAHPTSPLNTGAALDAVKQKRKPVFKGR